MTRRLPVLIVCALALAGCGSREKAILGEWSGGIVGAQASITLKDDHKWTGTLSAMGQSANWDGTWKLEGDSAELTVVNAQGKPIKEVQDQVDRAVKAYPAMAEQIKAQSEFLLKPMKFKVSEDNKSMTQTTGMKLVLNKVEKK